MATNVKTKVMRFTEQTREMVYDAADRLGGDKDDVIQAGMIALEELSDEEVIERVVEAQRRRLTANVARHR